MDATARLEFTYRLLDANGTVLFSKRYVIGKDKSATDIIAVPAGIPSGILFNKVTFADGSEINFQTVK